MNLLPFSFWGALALVLALDVPAHAEDPAWPQAPTPAEAPAEATRAALETACDDRSDNDGDSMIDCADADCASTAACKPDGGPENTDARCSDWIDNDGNGHVDCDDAGCLSAGIRACRGSWNESAGGGGGDNDGDDASILEGLQGGETVEDLMGRFGDKDGEATNELCADGDDNDGDGRIDCADLGCRFDPNVQVCRETPGLRFSVVSQLTQSYDFESKLADTRFTALQLRAFGPIPLIQDSFFLLSMRTERTPRLTFAMFQIPIGGGHYLNVNSGGGTLSTALIRSQQKQLLIEPPFYLFSAFEQGNGASAEIGGPVDAKGLLEYRVFVGGGSGRSNGNVGGRYFTYDNTNYTWTVGAQLGIDLIGFTSRWDNPMLYTPVQTALGLNVGVKFDQRAQERYPAANLRGVFRHGRFYLEAETFMKQELAFDSFQLAYNVGAGFLVWKKYLYLTADYGQYLPGEMKNPPAVAETDIRRQLAETQARAALHWYFWRNIGVLSAIYTHRDVEALQADDPGTKERELKLVGQYRF